MKKFFFTLLAVLGVYAAQAQCSTSFTTSVSGMNVTLTNTSSINLVPGSTPMLTYFWGDGNNSWGAYWPGVTASHTYATSGVYTITMVTVYYDSLNNNTLLCFDSTQSVVTVGNALPCATTVSTGNNGNGSYTFVATTPGGGSMTYNWDFGDGSTGTGNPVNHTYINSGNYTVTLITTGGGAVCTTTVMVPYWNGTLNCTGLTAAFTYSITNGSTVSFQNISTPVGVPGGSVITRVPAWDFGDGSGSTLMAPVHTYAAAGTYNVTLINEWVDTASNTVFCADTVTQSVTVTNPPPPANIISGNISWDTAGNNFFQTSVKVWLIVFDSATNIIDAVDSTIVSGGFWGIPYSFSGHAAGEYRTKAAVLSGAPGANMLAPTYHTASTYWGTANLINHTGGTSSGNNIVMQAGTSTSGPGFISGNVTLGAGKGTSTGVPGLLILLRDGANNMIRFTYTDANGDYSFGNLAGGTYNIYPENMPQITTPSAPINLVSGAYNVSGIDFVKNSVEIKPKTLDVPEVPAALYAVYPNPSNGTLNFVWTAAASEKVTISVVDMTGREVFKGMNGTNGQSQIVLGNVPSGVYFIKATAGNGTQQTQKIVIAK